MKLAGDFGIDLYPTPAPLVKRMLDGIDLSVVGAILEPSAGTGNILNVIKDRLDARRGHSYDDWGRGNRKQPVETTSHGLDIDCIEIDPRLQAMLRGDGWRVVHDDFLTYETHKRYGLIIMNPPFSDGASHLLKAIQMQERGGRIVCLLNAETLRNVFTNERRDLVRRLRDLEASVEYIPDAFTDAERRTDVEVALVKISIPRRCAESVIVEELRKAARTEAGSGGGSGTTCPQEMVHADFLEAMVERYQFEAKAGVALIEEGASLNHYVLAQAGPGPRCALLTVAMKDSRDQYVGVTVNSYINDLRQKYWVSLLADQRFTGILTSELRDAYLAKIQTLTDYEFSLYNIYTLRIEFGKLALGGIDKAIVDLFDRLSHKHHWQDERSENIHYFDGWKTNKAWKINRRVVLPLRLLEPDLFYPKSRVRISYNRDSINTLRDMEKVFSYLDGKPAEGTDIYRRLESAVNDQQTSGIELPYFNLTLYKKGTCHITFTNEDLLKKFNLYGSQRKQWLPPSYGRAAYADMTQEERDVVDSFEGKAEYAKTLARADFYLPAPEKMLLSMEAA